MKKTAETVESYLDALADDRREALENVRAVVRKNLGDGFQETIQYGMIGYSVPHSLFPKGYHCDPKQPLPFAALGSQKKHMSLYLHCHSYSPKRDAAFRAAWKKTGKQLDMGKSCLRFRSIDELALDVIGKAIRSMTVKTFVKEYEQALGATKRKK